MHFFLLWNIKEDILKDVGNQTEFNETQTIYLLKISLQGIWRKFERNESPWLVCVCISDPDNTEGDEDEVEEIGKTHVLLGKHYNKTSFVCLLHSSVWYNK